MRYGDGCGNGRRGTNRPWCAAVVVAIGAIALAGCKTSETTRVDGSATTPDSGQSASEGDIDRTPVNVHADGSTSTVVDTGTTGGGDTGETSDEAADPSAPADTGDRSEDDRSTNGEQWVPETGDFVLEDKETGSRWNLRGEAYAGPLKGKTLTQIPAFNSFWFAWSVFYHGSEIWKPDESNMRNEPGELGSGEGCLIPCQDIEMGCPGKDCIPALDYDAREYAGSERPTEAEMVEPGADGTGYLSDSDYVFGVVVDGEPRAYPHNIYWWHEIHNDRIGNTEYTVSFCPLTGSGIVFDGKHQGKPIRFGVSGRLFQSNLVMFDPETDTFWSQMLGRGIKGPRMGERLEMLPVVETTWERWKEMYPETLVTSSKTGYSRDYNSYPYGNYRENDEDTYGASNHQSTYGAKDRVLGLPGETKAKSKAFAFPEMDGLPGDRNVIHSTFEGESIIVVYEAEHRMAIPFRTAVDGKELTFVGTTAK